MSDHGDDPILDAFDATERRFPGSRQIIPPPSTAATSPPPEQRWDAHPLTFTVNGEEREFFLITALCSAIGLSAVSIRRWEREGWFPKASYTTPANGAIAGKRLYTREQIEGLVEIAREEGPFTRRNNPVTKTNFLPRARQLFADLRRKH